MSTVKIKSEKQDETETLGKLLGDGFSVVDSEDPDQENGASKKKEDNNPENQGGSVTVKKEDAKDGAVAEGDGNAVVQGSLGNVDSKKQVISGSGVGLKSEVQSKEEATEGDEKKAEKDDSLLITEEIDMNQEGTDKKADTSAQNGDVTKKRQGGSYVWVSNIARHIKATDLKKYFSQHGKVLTARIVTNGKNYFGYVSLDSQESVETCIKHLNNSSFEGKKIVVSAERPDCPKSTIDKSKNRKPEKKAEPKKKVDPLTTKYLKELGKEDEEKDKVADDTKIKTESEKGEKGEKIDKIEKAEKSKKKDDKKKLTEKEKPDADLRRELNMCKNDNIRLRRRLIEEQKAVQYERMKIRKVRDDIRVLEDKLHDERRKFDKERDHLVKKNRLEQLRLEADRVILEKEKDDLKRRRDELERDLRRFSDQQQRVLELSRQQQRQHKSRSRSPRGMGPKRYHRGEGPIEAKKPKWTDNTRTPPPPPKLSDLPSERNYEERDSRRVNDVYVPPPNDFHERGRHRQSFPPEPKSAIVVPPSRNWLGTTSYPPNSWSSGGPPTQSTQFNDRFSTDGGRFRPGPGGTFNSRGGDDHFHGGDDYRKHSHYEPPPRKY